MPMAIGSRRLARCSTFAGMMSLPRATSSRTTSTGSASRSATRRIWGVIVPWRAKLFWVTQSMSTPFAGTSRVRARPPVESEDAVQMGDFVLQQLGHRTLQRHRMLLPLQVRVAEGRRVGARHADVQVREGKAVVPHQEVLRPNVGDLRVDHGPALLVHLDEYDPHRCADLRRRHGPAHLVLLLRRAQRIAQVVRDEPRRSRLRILNPLAADPEDVIAQLANATHGHGAPIWGFGAGVQLGVRYLSCPSPASSSRAGVPSAWVPPRRCSTSGAGPSLSVSWRC